jgi:hypothetical protein
VRLVSHGKKDSPEQQEQEKRGNKKNNNNDTYIENINKGNHATQHHNRHRTTVMKTEAAMKTILTLRRQQR